MLRRKLPFKNLSYECSLPSNHNGNTLWIRLHSKEVLFWELYTSGSSGSIPWMAISLKKQKKKEIKFTFAFALSGVYKTRIKYFLLMKAGLTF